MADSSRAFRFRSISPVWQFRRTADVSREIRVQLRQSYVRQAHWDKHDWLFLRVISNNVLASVYLLPVRPARFFGRLGIAFTLIPRAGIVRTWITSDNITHRRRISAFIGITRRLSTSSSRNSPMFCIYNRYRLSGVCLCVSPCLCPRKKNWKNYWPEINITS